MNQLEAWKAAYRILADSRDAVLVLDADNVVRFANRAAEALFGSRLSLGNSFGNPVLSETTQEVLVPDRHGAMKTVEMSASDTSWDGKPAKVVSFRDVTERVAAQKRIDHLNRVLRAIRNVNQLIAHEHDTQRLIEKACELLVETRGYDGAWLTVGNPTRRVEAFAHAGWGGEFPLASMLREGRPPMCQAAALEEDACLIIDEPATACAGCPLSKRYGNNPSVITALRYDEDVYGVLGVSFPHAMMIDDAERGLLLEVAGDLAFALHDIEIRRLREESAREKSAVLEANRAVLCSASFEDTAKTILAICRKQTGAAAGYVALRENDDTETVLCLDPTNRDCNIAPGACIPIRGLRAEAYRENRIVLDNDLEPSADAEAMPVAQCPVRNAMFVPIAPAGKVCGTIGLVDTDGRFDQEDAARAQMLGEVLTIALQRSQILEALRRSEELHKKAQEVSKVGHWELGSYEGTPEWSDEVYRIFGLHPGEGPPSFTAHDTVIHPKEWPLLREAIRAGFERGEPFDLVFRIRRSNGDLGWLHAIGTPEKDGRGRTVRMFGTAQDVTELRRAQSALAERERLLSTITNNMSDMVSLADLDGRFVYASPSHRQLGYTPEMLVGRPVTEFLHEQDLPRIVEELSTGRTAGESRKAECRYRRADGSYCWLESVGQVLSDEAGEPSGFIFCSRDITEKKRYEATLREEGARAQRYLDVAAVILLGLDSAGRINLLNRRGCEVLGFDDERSALGRDWLELVPDTVRANVKATFEAIMAGDVESHARVEGIVETVGGERRRVVWHNAVVRDQEGRIVGTLSSGEDVTERRRMELQLAQSDRLSSMGMLAAGIAHEINNPLAYVLYNLESVSEDLPTVLRDLRPVLARLQVRPPSGQAEEDCAAIASLATLGDIRTRFDEALGGTRRIREIARGLGAFSRVEEEELLPVDLARVIEIAVNMAFNEIKYRARLVRDFGKTPTVLASEGRLAQVFLNLLINATHAIDAGRVQDNEIRVRTWSEGDMAYAEVRDTGSGIPPETLAQLFEPFFTTKKIGLGSGLGLAISKSIVESYGGSIEVASEVGTGTAFTIRLPVGARDMPATKPASKQPGDRVTDRGRVLVVDDEEGIRAVMVRMLRGHDVVQAVSGAEAKVLLERDQEFDLILCDMMMSDVSGMDLHQWLASEHPVLAERFIFVTGGAFTPRTRAYLSEVDNVRLEKPFDVANFKQIVRSMIREAKAGVR